VALPVDEHVAGLHVAVDDPGVVGGVERGEQIQADRGHRGGRQRALRLEDLLQAARGDVLHHQPGLAALLHDVVDGRHARVVELGGGAGLAHRPLAEDVALLVAQFDGEGDLLHRDLPLEDTVGGQPDRAHAAAPQHVGQRVAARDDTVPTPGVGGHVRTVPLRRAQDSSGESSVSLCASRSAASSGVSCSRAMSRGCGVSG
jgi:hypothetical protein